MNKKKFFFAAFLMLKYKFFFVHFSACDIFFCGTHINKPCSRNQLPEKAKQENGTIDKMTQEVEEYRAK